jgi:hypothetical protein
LNHASLHRQNSRGRFLRTRSRTGLRSKTRRD